MNDHEHCFTCGAQIFGGPGGWHTVDGQERCPEAIAGSPFHEPMEVLPGDFECCPDRNDAVTSSP